MSKYLFFSIVLIFSISCKLEKKAISENNIEIQTFISDTYELIKSSEESKAVIILFGGFGEKPSDIKREFKILEAANKNKISVLLMNYSQKLWLEESEKRNLAQLLQDTLEKYKLSHKDIYIGGFSSGGIVSIHISNYIAGIKEFYINPKGVFIADSPIDLLALYKTSKSNIKKDFSVVSVQESTWIINMFEEKLGIPADDISVYEQYAVYTDESNYTKNLEYLKNTKIRLYTEPDFKWWKEYRNSTENQTNAFYIKKLSESLKQRGFKNVEYIATQNKGYRANGNRHPHSWSIIDVENLINWILEK